jgi:hypothetical protein
MLRLRMSSGNNVETMFVQQTEAKFSFPKTYKHAQTSGTSIWPLLKPRMKSIQRLLLVDRHIPN